MAITTTRIVALALVAVLAGGLTYLRIDLHSGGVSVPEWAKAGGVGAAGDAEAREEHFPDAPATTTCFVVAPVWLGWRMDVAGHVLLDTGAKPPPCQRHLSLPLGHTRTALDPGAVPAISDG